MKSLCIGAPSKDPARFVDLGFLIFEKEKEQEYKRVPKKQTTTTMAQVCSRHALLCPPPGPGDCVTPSWGGLWVYENKGRLCCEIALQQNRMTLPRELLPSSHDFLCMQLVLPRMHTSVLGADAPVVGVVCTCIQLHPLHTGLRAPRGRARVFLTIWVCAVLLE